MTVLFPVLQALEPLEQAVALSVVATPVAMPDSDTDVSVPAHDVFALIYDVETESVTVTPAIFSRTDIRQKCLLSAPRVERQAGEAEFPAIILASSTLATPTNRGAGKVYIRHADADGVLPWREYITDLGGQGGAFYVGNKLWWFDIDSPLTTGGTQ